LETGRPSQTALLVASYRARASARPDPVCDDPWAAALAGEQGATLTRDYDAIYPHMELWTAVRTAYIDARVRRALALGARQVVVLGAGFDTRAARLASPGVRFFEVDRAETQREKLARLGAVVVGYPADAATYVACDFEAQDFVVELAAAGFAPSEPALVVWEGVTPYLTEAAVRATLRRVASGLAGESAIVFDHLRKKIVAGAVRDDKDLASRAFVGDLGEPLVFGVDDVLPLLYEEGFRRVRSLNFDEACLEHTGTYDRDRKFRFQGLAVASRAARQLP
jgi:methyltransferase (TIGR00027 family)